MPAKRKSAFSAALREAQQKAAEPEQISSKPDNQITKSQDTQVTSKPDNQQSDNPDSQISSNSDSQIVQYPESQHSGLPENQIARKQDIKMVSYQRKKKPEREAQIVYLPPELKERVKVYAVKHKREISEVAAEAFEQFLDREEGK